MIRLFDFHTHRLDARDALISVDPRQFDPQPGLWYSLGFHPWQQVEALSEEDFGLLEHCARHPQVLAIGEAGMDSLRRGSLETQAAVFTRHLRLADAMKKPLVVHSVRTTRQILDIRQQTGFTGVTLAMHGMRGNANVARTLLEAGCFLSFGIRFNPAAVLSTPLDRLLIETDDSEDTILDVAAQVAATLNLPIEEVAGLAADNAHRLLFG